jgi:hypothetical protein
VNVPRATCNGREQRKQGAHEQPAGLMLTHRRSISRSIERSRFLIPAPPCSKRGKMIGNHSYENSSQAVWASGSRVTLWPRRSSRLTKERRVRFTSIRSK